MSGLLGVKVRVDNSLCKENGLNYVDAYTQVIQDPILCLYEIDLGAMLHRALNEIPIGRIGSQLNSS